MFRTVEVVKPIFGVSKPADRTLPTSLFYDPGRFNEASAVKGYSMPLKPVLCKHKYPFMYESDPYAPPPKTTVPGGGTSKQIKYQRTAAVRCETWVDWKNSDKALGPLSRAGLLGPFFHANALFAAPKKKEQKLEAKGLHVI